MASIPESRQPKTLQGMEPIPQSVLQFDEKIIYGERNTILSRTMPQTCRWIPGPDKVIK